MHAVVLLLESMVSHMIESGRVRLSASYWNQNRVKDIK